MTAMLIVLAVLLYFPIGALVVKHVIEPLGNKVFWNDGAMSSGEFGAMVLIWPGVLFIFALVGLVTLLAGVCVLIGKVFGR